MSESEWSESVFEWIWEKITRCLNPRWQCLNPTWQISKWLPSSIWFRFNEWNYFCGNGGNQSSQVLVSLRGNTKMAESRMAKFKYGCHHQVESEWMSEVCFLQMVATNSAILIFPLRSKWVWEEISIWLNPRWPNSRWQNSRWLSSSS